jgi:hypothetical protein
MVKVNQEMKNSRKITKIHLPINDQDFPIIIGIVSPDPDYKLSLKLNKKLTISLRNISPVEFQDKDGNEFLFSRFSDTSGVPDSSYQLISNRSGNNFLLKKLKNIDHLLLLRDTGKNLDPEQIMSLIRGIDTVTGVFNFDFKTLKDKNLRYLA